MYLYVFVSLLVCMCVCPRVCVWVCVRIRYLLYHLFNRENKIKLHLPSLPTGIFTYPKFPADFPNAQKLQVIPSTDEGQRIEGEGQKKIVLEMEYL